MRARAWWLFLLLMTPVAGLYLFGPKAANAGPVFNAIGLAGVAAIVVGVRVQRPANALAWYLFAAGQTLFIGGDVLAYNYERFFGRPLPFPSIADVIYLGVFPSLIAGFLLLIGRHKRGADRESLIDSLVIATGVGLLSWIFLMAPYAHDATLSTSVKLTAIAYPLMDLLLLTVAVRLAIGGGNRSRATYMVIASIFVLFATDGMYGWQQLHTGYQPGSLLDGGWILFYLLFGAAALHPSMAVAVESAPARLRLTRTRLLILTVATFVAPVTGLFGPTTTSDRVVIAGCAIVLFGLVLVRMVGLVQRQESEAARARALEETADRLRELDRLKDQFVATVSHELRTPLTSIHGYLELVLEAGSDEVADEQREFLAIVDRNTTRLRRLVDDLLLVSEIDAGKLDLDLNDFELGALARESIESSRPHAEALGISLTFSAAGNVELTGDRVRLGQLVDNVVSNALKFTPEGGRVSVRTSRSNGSAVLEVEDTGIGVPADEQAQLFDRFFRARAANEGAIQGTGLGLAISQAIARAHGGLIEVSSNETAGTTFRVALPAKS
jgi:signal transduction histidine kinase